MIPTNAYYIHHACEHRLVNSNIKLRVRCNLFFVKKISFFLKQVAKLSTDYAFNSPVQNCCQESQNLYREARHCCYITKLEGKKVMVGLHQNARAKHFVKQ
jgi:hypothetical protein